MENSREELFIPQKEKIQDQQVQELKSLFLIFLFMVLELILKEWIFLISLPDQDRLELKLCLEVQDFVILLILRVNLF